MKLTPWADIRSHYRDTVVIGNGASIAVDPRFQYRSLYAAARQAGLLTKSVADVFAHFSTSDFEFVLRALSNAHAINRILKVTDGVTNHTYGGVKAALIKTIQRIHPERSDIEKDLPKIEKFLRRFGTVFSLNYDLVVYWGMLRGNEEIGKHRLKDCFDAKRRFVYDGDWLRKPYGTNARSTLVFYPHGSLFLGVDAFGQEEKIVSDSEKLVRVIARRWNIGDVSPLFVSEGTSLDKLQAIRRNGYLNQIYTEELTKPRDTLLLYGWSMSDQDQHILDALAKSKPQRVALSVYRGNGLWQNEAQRMLQRVKQTFRLAEKHISLFASDDAGAWKF